MDSVIVTFGGEVYSMSYSAPAVLELGTVAATTLAASTVQYVVQKTTRKNDDAKQGTLGQLLPGGNPKLIPLP